MHREIPGCERYQETIPVNQGPAPAAQKGGCFSSRKGKGACLIKLKENTSTDQLKWKMKNSQIQRYLRFV